MLSEISTLRNELKLTQIRESFYKNSVSVASQRDDSGSRLAPLVDALDAFLAPNDHPVAPAPPAESPVVWHSEAPELRRHMQAKLHHLRGEYDELEQKYARFVDQLVQYRRTKGDAEGLAQEERDLFEFRLRKMRRENDFLEEKNEQMRTELGQARVDLFQSEHRNRRLRASHEQLESRNASLRGENNGVLEVLRKTVLSWNTHAEQAKHREREQLRTLYENMSRCLADPSRRHDHRLRMVSGEQLRWDAIESRRATEGTTKGLVYLTPAEETVLEKLVTLESRSRGQQKELERARLELFKTNKMNQELLGKLNRQSASSRSRGSGFRRRSCSSWRK